MELFACVNFIFSLAEFLFSVNIFRIMLIESLVSLINIGAN